MNIDKAKLKLGIWYEDENGNVINQKEDLMWKTPEKARTYHSCLRKRKIKKWKTWVWTGYKRKRYYH